MNDPSNNPDPESTPQWLAEARQWFDLRKELLELELRHDVQNGKRLAIVVGLGAALVLAALPLLLRLLAAWLADRLVGSETMWTLVVALFAALVGGVLAWSAWRRFRRDMTALRDTRAELREDLTWVRDWLR